MARILIIDDDTLILKMLESILAPRGFTPLLERNPARGIERLRADAPDALILDVMMPDISGYDLCRQIRATADVAHVPILMLTARAQPIDRRTALAAGANDYLEKPVKPKELVARLETLLEAARQATAAPAAEATASGQIIAVFGLAGGIGRTTIAANLALALQQASRQPTTLLELTPMSGHVALQLRLAPEDDWSDLGERDMFSWAEVATRLTPYDHGLDVLLAPGAAASGLLPTAGAAQRLLDLLRAHRPFTIVDLPPLLTPAAAVALREANIVFHLVTPEIGSVETARRSGQGLAAAGIRPRQHFFLLNQVVPEAQLGRDVIERALGARPALAIPFDPEQTEAVRCGTPLAMTAPASALGTAARRIATAVWQRSQGTASGGVPLPARPAAKTAPSRS